MLDPQTQEGAYALPLRTYGQLSIAGVVPDVFILSVSTKDWPLDVGLTFPDKFFRGL